ncbi:hypothetical protein SAMN03159338_1783 [Sphingomonas sp. NFR04]|uniref:hypothetical protein n=1 Tax=Sphingomonas sp. NFR04 TaxID=1566283 RepID=UPI0008F1337D|nr:hypothetical protein [Sphingomonas sp. NFR04]SFJ56340.1 hypothetical protein SAMN03159338_1783 [Sphingomonas sp. NFR04]
MRRAGLALLLGLAACGGPAPGPSATAADLENAAIQRGLVRDPGQVSIAGAYARGPDRLCIVPAGAAHRIGIVIDYGEGNGCRATGSVRRDGEGLALTLGADGGCRFTARFDGDHLALPGALPKACAQLCTGRAALAGAQFARLGESVPEAQAMRDADGHALCGE